MTEPTAEDFIPGEDELETEQSVINFNVNDANIAKAKEEFKDVDAYTDMDTAKKAKKVLTKMRTTLAEAHKEQKAESLAYGRKLDTEKNRLLTLIAEVEDPISNQLKEIKEKAEREEQARLDAITENIKRLNSYAADRHDLNVEQIKERRENLAKEPLTEEIYQEQLANAKLAAEEADTKLRIVLQRELDAEEERKEQARIAEENAARKKELDEQQAGLDAQAEAQRREQEEKAAAARAEQKKIDDARQKELDDQAEEQAAAQKKIDDENERIAQEAADKQAAEALAEQEEAECLAELERAPDRDKLLVLVRHIEELVYAKPVMQSQQGTNTVNFACEQLTELAETVRKRVEEMK